MAGSTPIYGFPYPEPSDLVANYPALGEELAEDVEAVIAGLGSGLNLMVPTSIANTGGTATSTNGVTTYTAVNSVSLNGVFTSAYNCYRIIFSRMSQGAATTFQLRWRAAGTDNTANSYLNNGLFAFTTTVGANSATQTFHNVFGGNMSAEGHFVMDVTDPQATAQTQYSGKGRGYDSAGVNQILRISTGYHNVSASYDGFTVFPATSTTTGFIRVYGYQGA